MTTTAPAPRIGRLPVTFNSMGHDFTQPLVDVANGTTVLTTATVVRVQPHGGRATVVLTGDGDTTAALRVDADRMAKFAHALQAGRTITLRGDVARLDGGMPVLDLRGIAPTA